MVPTTDHALSLRAVSEALLNGSADDAKNLLLAQYPFSGQPAQKRNYSENQKTRIFARDGFIDRYTGKRLVFGGILRLFSFLMPIEFPYHKNGKFELCHLAYWQLLPTLDHVLPVTRGGLDQAENWITTSMMSNAAKANWTVEELNWQILPPGNLTEWDGLMGTFVTLVESDASYIQQNYIRAYYRIAKTILSEHY